MKHSDAVSYIFEQVEESCFSLFEGLGCKVSFSEDEDHELDTAFIAMIDAGSTELELSLFLRMPFSVLALTYPGADVTEIEEEKLEDWMAELSNMLIGKVKAKLMNHQVDIKIGLPESFFGVNFDDITPEAQDHKTYLFDVDGVPVECRIFLDLMVDELDVATETVDDDDLHEGELELF